MSLLTMTQAVCRRIGLPLPNSVSGSNDPQVLQLMALASEEGQDLSARYPWQALTKESTFASVATESQGLITTLAGSDFRYILNDIMWDRTLLRPVFGPLVPQDWQTLKARNVNGPFTQFRMRGNYVLFIPAPAAADTIAFEWVSRNWVTLNAGGTGAAWANDADTGIIDEEIMQQGVIWRWKAAKGLNYSEDYQKYEQLVNDQMARDGGKARLNLAGGMNNWPAGIFVSLGSWNV